MSNPLGLPDWQWDRLTPETQRRYTEQGYATGAPSSGGEGQITDPSAYLARTTWDAMFYQQQAAEQGGHGVDTSIPLTPYGVLAVKTAYRAWLLTQPVAVQTAGMAISGVTVSQPDTRPPSHPSICPTCGQAWPA